jgi:hypothetical protein
MLGLLELIRL